MYAGINSSGIRMCSPSSGRRAAMVRAATASGTAHQRRLVARIGAMDPVLNPMTHDSVLTRAHSVARDRRLVCNEMAIASVARTPPKNVQRQITARQLNVRIAAIICSSEKNYVIETEICLSIDVEEREFCIQQKRGLVARHVTGILGTGTQRHHVELGLLLREGIT